MNYKKKAWDTFSKYIRTKGLCEFHQNIAWMGIPSPCRCAGPLQACHKISRSKMSIKFDPRNNFCGCAGSNVWANYHQLEWDQLWRMMWPSDVEYLEERKNNIVRMNDWTYKAIIDEYAAKLL